jgi:hypothetical protein
MAEKDGREFDEKSIKYKDKIFTEPYQITPNEAKVWGFFGVPPTITKVEHLARLPPAPYMPVATIL